MTRVGLVGFGAAAQGFHAPMTTAAGMTIAAVSTSSPERAALVARDHPDAVVVPDLDALLVVEGLDLVVLASPSGVHAEQARRTLEAGIPVVVDKPLAVDAAAALAVVDRALGLGVPLTVFQNRRYDPEFRTMSRLVADGALGELYRAEMRWERWRPVPKQRWRERVGPEEGGGLLLDLHTHLVDQAVLLFGPVESVYAELESRTTLAEDDAFLSCRHSSGMVSHIGAMSVAAAPGPRVRLLGSEGAWVLGAAAEEATAFTEFTNPDDRHHGWLVRGDHREPVPAAHGDPVDFYRAVDAALRGAEPQGAMPVDPRDAVHVLAVIDAARASAVGHRVCEVVAPGARAR